MKRRRVKITGLGPVTPAGIGRAAFAAGILEPVSRVREYRGFARQGGGRFVAAEVDDDVLAPLVAERGAGRLPRHTQFALAGAALALRDCGLDFGDLRDRAPLVAVGASLMDFGVMNRIMETMLRKGAAFGLPSAVFSSSVSSISGAVAEVIGGATRTLALQSACCSGLDAIGQAADGIARGEADFAICGGTEAPLHFHPMLELKLAGLTPDTAELPERICRPFDRWRTTGVISEGASILVLEPEESPRPAYAWIDGYAYATDPADQPLEGLREAIRLTLANARVRPADVDCISAWGPGHKLVDRAEAQVLRAVFGARLAEIPVSSIKGALGNPLGAGGAIQAVSTALGLRDGVIPPTVNWQFPDPDCPLNLSAAARVVSHTRTLVNSHGLSGTNACLVLSK